MKQDSPWKEALEKYFRPFMELFFPEIHDDIDWKKGYTFLDKELEKIVRDAKAGSRRVDKLVRVILRNGKKTLILIHIEIQGYEDAVFGERMFIYYYRLFDRYRLPVVSLAVLTDSDPGYRPAKYTAGRWRCRLRFEFPVIKLRTGAGNGINWKKAPIPLPLWLWRISKPRSLAKERMRKEKNGSSF